MNKRFIFLSVVIILIIISIALLLKTNAVNNNASNQNQSKIEQTKQIQDVKKVIENSKTINFTSSGFDPKEITVKSGTRVIWVNNTEDTASVNSDPFPVNNYWTFLNLGSFTSGQNLTLIFDKLGTYSYHNQFNPKQTGTVIVK